MSRISRLGPSLRALLAASAPHCQAPPPSAGVQTLLPGCFLPHSPHYHSVIPASSVISGRGITGIIASGSNGTSSSSGGGRSSSISSSSVCGGGHLNSIRSSSSSSGAGSGGMVELRTYTARPDGLGAYLRHTADTAELRKRLSPGWIGFWTTETGGALCEVKHMYRFEGWADRESVRRELSQSAEWRDEYLPKIRPLLLAQHSMLLVEAGDCLDAIAEASLTVSAPDPAPAEQGLQPVFELRRYELKPGYDTMPTLRKHMVAGLPSRVAAQQCGDCVFMGYSEVGLLNVFLELWRYDSTLQCTQARRAARSSPEWRNSIAGIAEVTASFTTEYLRATPFSPLK